MTRSRILIGTASLALVLLGISSCSSTPSATQSGTTAESGTGALSQSGNILPVALSAPDTQGPVRIGIVVSLTSAPDGGSKWAPLAQGARVAVERFAEGDTSVELVTVDDRGTPEGAVEAMTRLRDEKVAGIVVATSGSHLVEAITTTGEEGIPLLLPYETNPFRVQGISSAWLTGPTVAQQTAVLESAALSAGTSGHVLVDAGGGPSFDAPARATISIPAGSDPLSVREAIASSVADSGVSSVVITGNADTLGLGLIAVQASGVTVPVLVTPDALTPRFAEVLAKSKAGTRTPLITAGLAQSDPTALESSADGQALSAFLAGVRNTADAPNALDIYDSEPFSASGAATAHPGAHDAVVALVRAADMAKSTQPADVLAALKTLHLTQADGIVSPALDFSTQTAIADEAVVALSSTTQPIGLRPAAQSESINLTWFKNPTP